MKTNFPFHVIVLFLTILFCYSSSQDVYTTDDLTAMTDEDLERICVSRGFEILRDAIDPTTGLPYTLSHEDFVEAAQSCLEIEREMNELLAEYPELAAEVEEEIKKLEAEQMERKAEVEMLQKELEQAREAATETSNSTSGPAFIPSLETGKDLDDLDATMHDDLEITEDADETLKVELDSRMVEEEDIVEGDIVEVEVKEETEDSRDDAIAENETRFEEELTMRTITFEIIRALVKQVESDVKRIVELMTPVIRPILHAGDVAWRHVRVAVESLRSNYENSRVNQHGDNTDDTTRIESPVQ